MEQIFGSKVKVAILMYLGLRGGCGGRRLAKVLKIHNSQTFKALHQMLRSGIIAGYKNPPFYALNPHYRHYQEILRMIDRETKHEKRIVNLILPKVADDRKVDPLAIYELLALRSGEKTSPHEKLSDVLRKNYG